MSWGTDLWDQFDCVATHTHKGIDFAERYKDFVKERCVIESEYAAKLKKLVKNYQPKKKDEEEYEFTCQKGFLKMVNEVNDLAGQHEFMVENFTSSIVKELQTMIQELKQERRKHLQEGAKHNSLLQSQCTQLERSKKHYERSFKEAEKAQDAFKKADADINLSRAEVEKAKSLMRSKQQACDECKNEYASELQKTNTAQNLHYNTNMPQTMQDLQDMDKKRIARVQEFVRQGAEIERSIMPIVNTCIDGMVTAANSMNPDEDIRLVIERHKSGFVPPGDIPFEDLSNANTQENHNNANTPKNASLARDTVKGTMSGGKKGKRGGLFGIFGSSKMDDSKEDYSHLPPNQQKKKLTQKIESLRQTIAKETAERDGMLKMRDVYVQNPALGDPSTLDKQLEENAQKLDKLKEEIKKYELQRQHPGQPATQVPPPPLSLSLRGHCPFLLSAQVVPAETDSGVEVEQRRDSSVPIADQDSFDDLDDDFPAIGTCRAMYNFEAPNDGSIPMKIGDELQIMEIDQGDGWTQVRHPNGDMGFVPTSYIECHLYEH
ncbi:hypothetical protein CAPTEDRAFT_199738 [Capitella teleta]|uniref:Formin-binding protein 1-like n=1 Tax=Capitella teleta TaxID=283909 RepID=R7V364_CAPTE|nr:hypothetical protein CAPTEDRAFT_199738 [Capitella teleta]|eukprot:ELU13004.1 hypothetical protein CAPTEDRAFT_199738 [Capitella teleta]